MLCVCGGQISSWFANGVVLISRCISRWISDSAGAGTSAATSDTGAQLKLPLSHRRVVMLLRVYGARPPASRQHAARWPLSESYNNESRGLIHSATYTQAGHGDDPLFTTPPSQWNSLSLSRCVSILRALTSLIISRPGQLPSALD
jgi:hypothetical protein